MDRLKGLGSSLVGAAGNMVDKSGFGEKISQLKENYLNKVYDIGHRRFTVKRLIAEGGFGFVFQVREVGTERQYALKRILVQDRERLPAIKSEVSLMRALARQPNVVTLEDHKMTDNRTDIEVLLLMEYCSCSLLDGLMQGRLRSEQDIYDAFSQICAAVARLHSNNPPISHRDLKVENVLFAEDGTWKLCDFGSATTATYMPTNERERSIAEEDINRNTTMMYRAPEMVDLYRRQPITEKVDIWALGCVLFKMAYLVDAFDGGLGILNARYTFPEVRRTSATFEEFIGYLLNPDPEARPNIQQVQERLATLRGVPAPKQAPSARAPANNNISLSNNSNAARPSSAPTRKPSASTQKPVADLLDWGDSTPTNPQQKASSPAPTHISSPLSNSQPTKPSTPSLLDALDWEFASSTLTTNPSSPAPKTAHPHPQPKQPQQQHSQPQAQVQLQANVQAQQPQPQRSASATAPSHSSKPRVPPKPTSSSHKASADLPDLLDFSDPAPKLSSAATYPGPPVATPSQYYSPQPQHRPVLANNSPTYYSPPFAHTQPPPQANRPFDPLAQFTLAKPQTAGGLEDFDPLAKKPQTASPLSTSHSPSPSPLSTAHSPSSVHLPPPRTKAPSASDSLITF